MSPFSLASIPQGRLQHEVVGANWVVNPSELQEISAYFRESAVTRWLQSLHQGCWGIVIADWISRIFSRSFLKYRPSYIIIHSSRCISRGSLSRMNNSRWQIESYVILIDVQSWLTFRRFELSQFRLEALKSIWMYLNLAFDALKSTPTYLKSSFDVLKST